MHICNNSFYLWKLVCLFEDRRRSNFLKSWLIFYRFGLDDSLEVFCFPPPENELLSVEEKAACEMYEYYKFWVDCNLHGESFEVYDTTDGRGLGIWATKQVSLGTLSLEMVFFLCVVIHARLSFFVSFLRYYYREVGIRYSLWPTGPSKYCSWCDLWI